MVIPTEWLEVGVAFHGEGRVKRASGLVKGG